MVMHLVVGVVMMMGHPILYAFSQSLSHRSGNVSSVFVSIVIPVIMPIVTAVVMPIMTAVHLHTVTAMAMPIVTAMAMVM